MIEKSEAVVLKSMKYRDTSKIVTFYTRRYGKLACLAKGAREFKSKFGSSLEALTECEIVFYRKEERDLQLLSQASTLRTFKNVHSDGDRLGVGFSIAEMVDHLAREQEEHAALYGLISESLETLEHSEGNFVNILYAFEVRLASLFGFAPSFTRCARCGRELGHAAHERILPFLLDKGGPVCADCRESLGPVTEISQAFGAGFAGGVPLSRLMVPLRSPTRELLERLGSERLASVAGLEYDPSTGNELEEMLRLYFQYHFENFRPLRAPGIFGLTGGSGRPKDT